MNKNDPNIPFGRDGKAAHERLKNQEKKQARAAFFSAVKARIRNALSGIIHYPIQFAANHPKKSLATGAVSIGALGFITVSHYLDPETHLRKRDPNYHDKCVSFKDGTRINAENAKYRAERILNLIKEFGEKGKITATNLKASKEIFCYGLDNSPTTEHWSTTKVYLSPANYPDSLSALFYSKADFETFWRGAVTPPSKINQYTPDSGLIFSRAVRAFEAVEKIKNFYRATHKSTHGDHGIKSIEWEMFISENPTYKNAIPDYIQTMKTKRDEQLSMLDATKSLMQDSDFLNKGDIKYLTSYLYHVSLIEKSTYEDIYTKSFSFFGANYAFVDIDRDGHKDDVIELSYGNRMVDYKLNVSRINFDQKQTEYDCSETDENGNVTQQKTCAEDVSELVHYIQIPAIDTATVTLNPETLNLLAQKTETSFVDTPAANRIIHEIVNGTTLYAQPLSTEAQQLMTQIANERRKNIPNRPTTIADQALGLR